MSAWRIGSRRPPIPKTTAGNDLQEYVDRIVKWIPGDVLVIYASALTLFAAIGPSVPLLISGAVLTFVVVILAAWATGPVKPGQYVKAALGFVAFLIWAVTVPSSGWQAWAPIATNPGLAAFAAGVVGLVFSLVAEGAVLRWAKDSD